MKKPKIYLDTSVISHMDQADAPEKMEDTLSLWKEIKQGRYSVYVSDLVFSEIMSNAEPKRTVLLEHMADIQYTSVSINDEIRAYAEKIIEEGILTQRHFDDCLHIGAAVISECNYLLSWNFKHMVKVKTVNGIRSINAMLSYHGIDIYSPNMLID